MLETLSTFLPMYAAQAFGYFAVVGLTFFLFWHLGAKTFARRRIVPRGRKFDSAQLRHEVLHSLIVLAIGTAQAQVVFALHEAGCTRLGTGLGVGGLPAAIAMGIGLILFNDLWFYGVHRLLHTRWLYKHVHSVHHRSVDVNPFSSYSFHALEAVLVTAWLLPVALLVPLSMPVLMAVQTIGLANNVMAHLGYELLPAWWVSMPVLRWSNSATFHSRHHASFNGNYGLFTRFWDRLFQTELESYDQSFAAAHMEMEQASEASPPSSPARTNVTLRAPK